MVRDRSPCITSRPPVVLAIAAASRLFVPIVVAAVDATGLNPAREYYVLDLTSADF